MAYKTNEKRSKKIYISDGLSICPSVDVFYGPYESLNQAVTNINTICENISVAVPLGITVAVFSNSSHTAIKTYINKSGVEDQEECKISDFVEIGGASSGGNSNITAEFLEEKEYIDIE